MHSIRSDLRDKFNTIVYYDMENLNLCYYEIHIFTAMAWCIVLKIPRFAVRSSIPKRFRVGTIAILTFLVLMGLLILIL